VGCNELVLAIEGLRQALVTSSCGCEVGQGSDNGAGQQGGPIPDDLGDIAYQEPVVVDERKCKAANILHETLFETFDQLAAYPVTTFALYGLVFVIGIVATVVAFLASPVVALIVGVAGLTAGFGGKLLAGGFDLADIATALTDGEEDLICSLYEAGTVDNARDSYLAELVVLGLNAIEVQLVEFLMTNAALNLLFFDTEESAVFWDTYTAPFDCSTCSVFEGSWKISPSGAWGTTAVGGGPLGSGVVDNDGNEFDISSVEIEPGVGDYFIGLEIDGWDNNIPDAAWLGGQIEIISVDPSVVFYAKQHQKNDTLCDDPILLDTSAGTFPQTNDDWQRWYFASSDGPFTLTLRIIALPIAC
jgi:hypothetical protein